MIRRSRGWLASQKVRIGVYVTFLCLGGAAFTIQAAGSTEHPGKILVIQLKDDTINPVTAEYIIHAITRAEQQKARFLLIKLDTPGGLLTSTRSIVKAMLTSRVPVVVYISPSGARAGSAGVFLTYASHVAAMAPSTNIGAAHPVQLGDGAPRHAREWDELKEVLQNLRDQGRTTQGQSPEASKEAGPQPEASARWVAPKDQPMPSSREYDPMSEKLLQDSVAFIKAIAMERNRNVEWAVASVAESSSITSEEARDKGVIDMIAVDDRDLFEQLDQRAVKVDGRETTIETDGAAVEFMDMGARQKLFNVLANPNIAYFLLIFGFYGFLFEITHPGFGLPGILGIIFLVLAFYSMQMLPTNYAGLALVVLGIAFLIAEAFTTSFGVLLLGGVTCLVLGSMLLFDSNDPLMRVSRSIVLAFSMTTAGLTLFLMHSVLRAYRGKIRGGAQGLIGEVGEARTTFGPGKKGKIFVHGELWNAVSKEPIEPGDAVTVVEVNGLMANVVKKS